MKRFLNYYLSMTLLASLFLVTSCGEDEDALPDLNDPTLEIGGEDADVSTFDVGDVINLQFTFTAPEQISSFNYITSVDGIAVDTTYTNPTDLGFTSNETEGTIEFSYPVPAELAGRDVEILFQVVDKQNNDGTATFDFTVNALQDVITTYNTVLLMAPVEDQTSQVWFSTSTGERYSTQAVNSTTDPISGEIDFGYRYGPSAGATLASPAAYPTEGGQNTTGWANSNETMLRGVATGVTETEFLEMGTSSQELMEAYERGTAGTNPQQITGLNAGDVLAFMTDPDKEGGSRYGLIYVEDIDMGADGTGYGSDASITLNVKVQASVDTDE